MPAIYATPDDMRARIPERELIERTDLAGSAIDDFVLSQALLGAAEIIERYIGSRYTLPLPLPHPPGLVGVACALARYALYDYEPPEAVDKGRDEALAWLGRVGNGAIELAMPSQTPANTVQFGSQPRSGGWWGGGAGGHRCRGW